MLTTDLFRYTSEYSPFCSQIFNFFFASCGKGALIPLARILRTFLFLSQHPHRSPLTSQLIHHPEEQCRAIRTTNTRASVRRRMLGQTLPGHVTKRSSPQPLQRRRIDRVMTNVAGDDGVTPPLSKLCRERQRADTTGTVPVPWAGRIQC